MLLGNAGFAFMFFFFKAFGCGKSMKPTTGASLGVADARASQKHHVSSPATAPGAGVFRHAERQSELQMNWSEGFVARFFLWFCDKCACFFCCYCLMFLF